MFHHGADLEPQDVEARGEHIARLVASGPRFCLRPRPEASSLLERSHPPSGGVEDLQGHLRGLGKLEADLGARIEGVRIGRQVRHGCRGRHVVDRRDRQGQLLVDEGPERIEARVVGQTDGTLPEEGHVEDAGREVVPLEGRVKIVSAPERKRRVVGMCVRPDVSRAGQRHVQRLGQGVVGGRHLLLHVEVVVELPTAVVEVAVDTRRVGPRLMQVQRRVRTRMGDDGVEIGGLGIEAVLDPVGDHGKQAVFLEHDEVPVPLVDLVEGRLIGGMVAERRASDARAVHVHRVPARLGQSLEHVHQAMRAVAVADEEKIRQRERGGRKQRGHQEQGKQGFMHD